MNRYLYALGDPVRFSDPAGTSVTLEYGLGIGRALVYTLGYAAGIYVAVCDYYFAASAIDLIEGTNGVSAIWQWCMAKKPKRPRMSRCQKVSIICVEQCTDLMGENGGTGYQAQYSICYRGCMVTNGCHPGPVR